MQIFLLACDSVEMFIFSMHKDLRRFDMRMHDSEFLSIFLQLTHFLLRGTTFYVVKRFTTLSKAQSAEMMIKCRFMNSRLR